MVSTSLIVSPSRTTRISVSSPPQRSIRRWQRPETAFSSEPSLAILVECSKERLEVLRGNKILFLHNREQVELAQRMTMPAQVYRRSLITDHPWRHPFELTEWCRKMPWCPIANREVKVLSPKAEKSEQQRSNVRRQVCAM
jgi:hypothetical protein